MTYKALYRTYRPARFDEVVGQRHVVATLKNSIINNRVVHAYLFCGPRGTGKTTIAKLFSKAVNCESFENEPCNKCDNCIGIDQGYHPDVIEIDAASNNGVDEIRGLIDKVNFSPMNSKYKVYIIDEVHMLTQGAFNALLKTLEEPPEHAIFILCTTEPHKVIATILSRCQRYDFEKVSNEDIVERLSVVCNDSKIKIEEDSLKLIARLAEGGMRDALSILDQSLAYASDEIITTRHISEIYGLVTNDELISLLENIKSKDIEKALSMASGFWKNGVDIKRLTTTIVEITKEAAIYSYTSNVKLLDSLKEEEAKKICSFMSRDELVSLMEVYLEALEKYRTTVNAVSYFEMAILKSADISSEGNIEVVKTVVKEEKKDNSNSISTVDEMAKKLNELGVDTVDVSRETKEEVKEKPLPVVPVIEDVEIDEEELLEILVVSTKEIKEADLARWNNNANYLASIEYGKYANLVCDSEIVASSEDCIIISTKSKAVCDEINLASESNVMQDFLTVLLGVDKCLYAICEDEKENLIKEFIKRRNEGTLPTPSANVPKVEESKIIQSEVELEEEIDIEQRMESLFGEGSIDLLDDGGDE